jgi:hypothetical protein
MFKPEDVSMIVAIRCQPRSTLREGYFEKLGDFVSLR